MARHPRPGGLARRLGWFVGLWAAGVAALALVAYALRLVIGS